MDPFILVTALVIIATLFGGVWGTNILLSLLKRRNLRLESSTTDPRIEEIQADHRLLLERFERLEEEIGFFRELHGSPSSTQLPPPDDG